MDVDEVNDAPKMTVNLKRLTRVLAKQWTEVSSEEPNNRSELRVVVGVGGSKGLWSLLGGLSELYKSQSIMEP